MVNQIPQIGRIALIQVNGVTVAYAQGYTAKETAKNIKEYCLANTGTGGDWPAVAAPGNKDYTIDINALYVDNTYHNLIEQGAVVTAVLGPVGSSGGNTKITVPCLISSVEDTVAQEKITSMKVSMESTGQPTSGTW